MPSIIATTIIITIAVSRWKPHILAIYILFKNRSFIENIVWFYAHSSVIYHARSGQEAFGYVCGGGSGCVMFCPKLLPFRAFFLLLLLLLLFEWFLWNFIVYSQPIHHYFHFHSFIFSLCKSFSVFYGRRTQSYTRPRVCSMSIWKANECIWTLNTHVCVCVVWTIIQKFKVRFNVYIHYYKLDFRSRVKSFEKIVGADFYAYVCTYTFGWNGWMFLI